MNDFGYHREKIMHQRGRENFAFPTPRGIPMEFNDENLSLYAAHLLKGTFKSTNLSSKGLFGPVTVLKTETLVLKKNYLSSKFDRLNDLKAKIPYLFQDQRGLHGSKKLLKGVSEVTSPLKKEPPESHSINQRPIGNNETKFSPGLVRIKTYQSQTTRNGGNGEDLNDLFKSPSPGDSNTTTRKTTRPPPPNIHNHEQQVNVQKISEYTSPQNKVEFINEKPSEASATRCIQNFRFVHVGSAKPQTPLANRRHKTVNIQVCQDPSSLPLKTTAVQNEKLSILFTQKFSKRPSASLKLSEPNDFSIKRISTIPDNERISSESERIGGLTERIARERVTPTINRKISNSDIKISERKIMTTTSPTKKLSNIPTLNQRQSSIHNLTNVFPKSDLLIKVPSRQDMAIQISSRKSVASVTPLSKEGTLIYSKRIRFLVNFFRFFSLRNKKTESDSEVLGNFRR